MSVEPILTKWLVMALVAIAGGTIAVIPWAILYQAWKHRSDHPPLSLIVASALVGLLELAIVGDLIIAWARS